MLATESSIHTFRIFAITISNSVMCAELSKNENTWCEMLAHYDAE